MKIAIIGSGLCGLALSLALKEIDEKNDVTVFFKDPIESIASHVSTGLLHPFVGKYARKSWRADEGIKKTKELIALSESYLKKTVAKEGILRLPEKIHILAKVSKRNKETQWFESCQHFHKDLSSAGMFIPEGMTVFSSLYLQGLYQASVDKGVKFEKKEIKTLSECKGFNPIILAAGEGILDFEECKTLPIEKIKGQTLYCKWPENTPYLPLSIVCNGHISLCEDERFCYLGSTYERNYSTIKPDKEAVLLKEKVAVFFPLAKELKEIDSRAAIRLSRIGSYIPLVFNLSPSIWVMGGVGSRGLLYHALIAKLLARAICFGEKLPQELYPLEILK